MPAAAVASRTPSRAGMSGTVFGASGEVFVTTNFSGVMPAPVAGIHVCLQTDHDIKDVDGRDKPGHAVERVVLAAYFFSAGAGIAGAAGGVAGLSSRSTFA